MKGRSLFKSPLPRSYLSDTASTASSAAVATQHRVYQVWRGKNVIRLISPPRVLHECDEIILSLNMHG